MGSGASSASPLRAAIAETSEEDLKAALNAMKPEDLARFSNMVDEAGKAAEAAPKAPTFEKAPMEVPGISREEELPKRSIVSIAPPAGRPRSAEMKKKVAPVTAIAGETKQEAPPTAIASETKQDIKPETSKAGAEVAAPTEEGTPGTDKGNQEAAATKIQAIQRGKVARRSVSQAGEDKTEDAPKDEQAPTVTKDEVKPSTPQAVAHFPEADVKAEAPKTDAENAIASKLENKTQEPAMAEHTEAMAEK